MMQIVRRILATVALALAVSSGHAEATLKIVATTSDLAWFAREIGGERVAVTSIARGYQDPHYVEPKPSYIVALSKASLLLHVGLELEVGWLPKLLDGAHNPHIQESGPGIWSPAGVVRVLEKSSGNVDRSAGDIHPFGNPHYWLDPDNARAIASGLGEKLAGLDPAGAVEYRARAAALAGRIEEKDAGWKARLAPFKGTRIITYHKTYSYFVEHFGLEVAGFVEPRPGVPPSAAHLARLVATAVPEGVRLLLIESYFDPRDAKFIAGRTGIPLAIAPVSVDATKEANDWFALIELLVAAVETGAKAK